MDDLAIEMGGDVVVSVWAPEPVTIRLGADQTISGLLIKPDDAVAGYVLAHSAGAGMDHPFMSAVAEGLAARRIATLRYQFPFMESGSRRPDRPGIAHKAVRAAVAAAADLLPDLALFAGGKSFGGRMTSQAQAAAPLARVGGLVFLGFPLHPAKKPSSERAGHLADVQTPMLFLQGSRDALAELDLMKAVVGELGERATLHVVEGADHAFHVPARLNLSDQHILDEMLDTMNSWLKAILHLSR